MNQRISFYFFIFYFSFFVCFHNLLFIIVVVVAFFVIIVFFLKPTTHFIVNEQMKSELSLFKYRSDYQNENEMSVKEEKWNVRKAKKTETKFWLMQCWAHLAIYVHFCPVLVYVAYWLQWSMFNGMQFPLFFLLQIFTGGIHQIKRNQIIQNWCSEYLNIDCYYVRQKNKKKRQQFCWHVCLYLLSMVFPHISVHDLYFYLQFQP